MVRPLTLPFLRYIESTRHLVLYRVNSSYPIPAMLRLPFVETICFLDCSPKAISHLLYRPFFPSLQRIHYLSVAPSDPLIYERFPSVDWIFPWRKGRVYPFYDAMVESGRGRMDPGLLSQYVVRWSLSVERMEKEKKQGKKGSEVWMDFYLPERGIVSGKEYMDQQMSYLHKKHCDMYCAPYPVLSEEDTILPFPPSESTPHAVGNARWTYGESLVRLEDMFDRHILRLSS